jgi:low affinity Fe/Cu permease
MDKLSMIMSAVFLGAMLIWIAPRIIAFNQGKALRNIALWVAIFFGLALIYKSFGPDSPHPLFRLPASMSGMHRSAEDTSDAPAARADDKNNDGGQGFTPPKE